MVNISARIEEKLFLSLIFYLLSSIFLLANSEVRLMGLILDEQQKELENVTIRYYYPGLNLASEVKSGKGGSWQIPLPRIGPWYLEFKKSGFETKKVFVLVSRELDPELIPKVMLHRIKGLIETADFQNRLAKADGLLEKGLWTEALISYQKLLSDYPEAFGLIYLLGLGYWKSGEYEAALDYFSQTLEKMPDFIPAILACGDAYLKLGKVDLAKYQYSQIDLNRVNDPVLCYEVGLRYLNMAYGDFSLKCLQRALQLQPNFVDAYYYLGLLYLSRGDFKSAVRILQQYLFFDCQSDRAVQVNQLIALVRIRM